MAKKEKRPVSQSPEELDANLDAFINTFRNESDRGAVLVAAALLDEVLERILREAMSDEPHIKKKCIDPLFAPEAALATFASKIKIGRAFGILADWMYEDLEIIRKIRNEFAHSHATVDFSNLNVSKLIDSLKSVNYMPVVIEVTPERSHIMGAETRFKFLLSASCLIYVLERGAATHWLQKKLTEITNKLETDSAD